MEVCIQSKLVVKDNYGCIKINELVSGITKSVYAKKKKAMMKEEEEEGDKRIRMRMKKKK